MKRVCVWYHMEKPGEDAESCITIPMEDLTAEDLLEQQEAFWGLDHYGELRRLLVCLAQLQGYESGEFVKAEE